MKAIACILVLYLCGALAATEKSVEDSTRDKRSGLVGGGSYGYSYPAYTGYSGIGAYHGGNLGYSGYSGHLGYSGYGGNLGYAGYGSSLGYAGYGGNLGYAGYGYGGHRGHSSYVAPAVATKVVAAPAVSYAAYPYSGGYSGGHYGAYYGGHYTPHSGLW